MKLLSRSALIGSLLFGLALQEDAEWLERGRALLDAGQGAEAQLVFEAARELAPEDKAPEVWIVRSWLAQGRINDSLDRIDALVAAGLSGPSVDYLYGMAWFEAAESKRRSGAPGDSLRRNQLDAIHHLTLATEQNPSRYRDAFRPLAKTAWLSQRLDLAAPAAASAAKYYPDDPRIAHLEARIAHEEFSIARADPGGSERADALAALAEAAYRRAIATIGEPQDANAVLLLAESWAKLGGLLIERGSEADVEGGAEALSKAIAWKPDHLDYRELSALVAPAVFLRAVEQGLSEFEARVGRGPECGGAYWWLGYTAFKSGDLDLGERAFVAALASKAPGVESAWYYLGRLRYVRRNLSGAVAALRASWERDPIELFSALDVDKPFNVAMLEALASWCAREQRTVDATIFYELSAEFTQSAAAWYRLAEYLTAEAQRLSAKQGADAELARRSEQTALTAYTRALELEPHSPLYLLATARHLHRVLAQELERARTLYQRAQEEASRALADPDLALETSTELRAIRSEARRSLEELNEPEEE